MIIKTSLNKSRSNFSAFSLIELSVVMLVIGILVIAIISGANMVSRSRLTAAQTLVQSSPFIGIGSISMWLETSLDRSFKSDDAVDGHDIGIWNDINPSSKVVVIAAVGGTGPKYSTTNTINSGIPSVKFSNSSTNYLTIKDASFLNNSDYTICILEKRASNQANNYFIGDTATIASNQNLLLGYSSDGTVIHSQAGTVSADDTNSYASPVNTFASSTPTPRFFCFVQNSITGKETYIDGALVSRSDDKNQLSGITSLSIGKNYNGQIGEIVIFSKALTVTEIESVKSSYWANLFIGEAKASPGTSEMNSVADYVSDKFAVKMAVAGTSCVGGTVVNGSCNNSTCNVPAINGIPNGTTVNNGTTSLACPSPVATGTISYTCTAGIFNQTGGSCSCSAGYVMSGGLCQPSCSVTGITGINTTTVAYTSTPTTMNCNQTGYNASDSISYTCIGGSFVKTSGACDACAAGYAWNGSACVITCSSPNMMYNSHCYTYKGSYTIGQGGAASWGQAVFPVTKTCQEACAIVFGNVAANYRCSITNSSITATAHVDQSWVAGCLVFADTYKLCTNYFNAGCGACTPHCGSAYVVDNCANTINYCFLF